MKNNMLKRLDMEDEFHNWMKDMKTKNPFQIGSKVRFKKGYGFQPFSSITNRMTDRVISKGDIGIITPSHARFVKDVIQVTVDECEVPFWKNELNEYLEEI